MSNDPQHLAGTALAALDDLLVALAREPRRGLELDQLRGARARLESIASGRRPGPAVEGEPTLEDVAAALDGRTVIH